MASERAPLGVKVMQHGKDFSKRQAGDHDARSTGGGAEGRSRRRKRIYGIMYSERLEVKAAVKAGSWSRRGQSGGSSRTINIAPHQIVAETRTTGRAAERSQGRTGSTSLKLYGGILTEYRVAPGGPVFCITRGRPQPILWKSQIANVGHPQHPGVSGFRRHGAARQ